MILADTSAWVEFDRATGSPVDVRLTELLAADDVLAITEPVVMEVLAGARTDGREADLRRLLLRAALRPVLAPADHETAARVHRRCRGTGVTPCGLLDCLIATVAWRTGDSLLAQDADLIRVATVLEVPLDPASGPR